jgi:hypothetical protein
VSRRKSITFVGLLILFGFLLLMLVQYSYFDTLTISQIYALCIKKGGAEYSSLSRHDAVSFDVYLLKLRRNLPPPSSGWMEVASSAEKSVTVPHDTASICMLGSHGIQMETESSD